ncbi:hypothetical protein [Siphonobacter sp. BAB-5385]|uniref:hypothetical protein n=1 Tax=Siphonobacter sp. BAB-5385 TaxID=1864822 RepID=UPI000B9E3EB3|nr:hypothetical protein [Siphonobacter sp. BAB-5385]
MNDRCTQHKNELLEIQSPELWQQDIKSTLTRALATPDVNLTHEERVLQNDRLIALMCACCKYSVATKE